MVSTLHEVAIDCWDLSYEDNTTDGQEGYYLPSPASNAFDWQCDKRCTDYDGHAQTGNCPHAELELIGDGKRQIKVGRCVNCTSGCRFATKIILSHPGITTEAGPAGTKRQNSEASLPDAKKPTHRSASGLGRKGSAGDSDGPAGDAKVKRKLRRTKGDDLMAMRASKDAHPPSPPTSPLQTPSKTHDEHKSLPDPNRSDVVIPATPQPSATPQATMAFNSMYSIIYAECEGAFATERAGWKARCETLEKELSTLQQQCEGARADHAKSSARVLQLESALIDVAEASRVNTEQSALHSQQLITQIERLVPPATASSDLRAGIDDQSGTLQLSPPEP